MNGARSDLRRKGHGRNFCVLRKVAWPFSRARSFEEVAAPRCVYTGAAGSRQAIMTMRGTEPKRAGERFRACAAALRFGGACLLACLALSACGAPPVEET